MLGSEGNTAASNIDPGVHGSVDLTDDYGSYVDLGQPPTPPFPVGDDILGPLNEDTALSRAPEFRPEDVPGGEPPTGALDQGPDADIPLAPPVDQTPVITPTPPSQTLYDGAYYYP